MERADGINEQDVSQYASCKQGRNPANRTSHNDAEDDRRVKSRVRYFDTDEGREHKA